MMQCNLIFESKIFCTRNEVPQQFAIELAKRNIDIIIMWKGENYAMYNIENPSSVANCLKRCDHVPIRQVFDLISMRSPYVRWYASISTHSTEHFKHRHFGYGGNCENEITCILIRNYWQTVWFINVAYCIPFRIRVSLTRWRMFLKELHFIQVLRIWL